MHRVKVILFVMAKNESDACVAAAQAPFDIFECIAIKAETIDPEWNDAIAYNADDERTYSEIITNAQQTTPPETSLMKLLSYVETAIRVFTRDNRSIQSEG